MIAGGGFAALEALIALRRLAGHRIDLTLVSPEPQLSYRPLAVVEPFGLGEAPRFELAEIARDHDAELYVDAATSVDSDAPCARHAVRPRAVPTTGCSSPPARSRSRRSRARSPTAALRTAPPSRSCSPTSSPAPCGSVAFAVPAGAAWPLPLYELALMTASRAAALGAQVEFTLVTAEAAPLALFGRQASEAVDALLRDHAVAVHTSRVPVSFTDGSLSCVPEGSVEVERVVALPHLRGNAPAGLPTDADGFIPVDVTGRVRDTDRVYAAGDVTDFPIKQGGIATQQADAAARAIATEAGATVTAEDFRPVLRGLLLTGEGARFLRAEVSGGRGDASKVSRRLLWWPEMKVAGRYLSHYLSREAEPIQPADPLPADAIPIEVDLSEISSGA